MKGFALLFVASMILLQIPELRYDAGKREPVVLSNSRELRAENIEESVYAVLEGKANFEHAFVYQRYGLNYSYFNIDPYGMDIIARTYDTIDASWLEMESFEGKLRPFDDQPFSYRIEEILFELHGESVPEGACFLAIGDVPEVSGWQVGAVVVAALILAAMSYLFFVFLPKRKKWLSDGAAGSLET